MKWKTALWFTLVIFTIHNIEEYFTMPGFYTTHASQIPAFAARIAKPIPNDLFITMIILITLFAVVLVRAGFKGGPNSFSMFCAISWVMGGILVNGLHHLALTLFFIAYTPGVISSVLLFVPFAVYFWRKALTEKLIDQKRLLWSVAAGTIGMIPVILVSRVMAAFLLTFTPNRLF
ncbi:MAG: HXXEE domain-containing protein [Solirubrobacterales bacterium]